MPLDRRAALHTDAGRRATPLNGLLLAYASVAPIAAAAILAWIAPPGWRSLVVNLAVIWSGAVLCFLAGVRRGDSFHTVGGPTALQLAAIFGPFSCAFLALAVPWRGAALALLMAGFAGAGVFDTAAADRGQAPRFFARVRPPQMVLAVAGLVGLLALGWH